MRRAWVVLWMAVVVLFVTVILAAVMSYDGVYMLGPWFRACCGVSLALVLVATWLVLLDINQAETD